MRFTLSLSFVFVALTVSSNASPMLERRQDIDFVSVLANAAPVTTLSVALPTPTTFYINTASLSSEISAAAATMAASSPDDGGDDGSSSDPDAGDNYDDTSMNRRDTQPDNSGCVAKAKVNTYSPSATSPDDPQTFQARPDIAADSAKYAKTQNIPKGYALVFSGLNTVVNSQLWYSASYMTSYDVPSCARLCNAKSACLGFNMYVERDNAANSSPTCQNPSSRALAVCVLHGYAFAKTDATNAGLYKQQFHVVEAGSNGYLKDPAQPKTLPGFNPPSVLGDYTVNAPDDPQYNKNTYIGQRFFPNIPLTPELCGQQCTETSDYDAKTAPASGKCSR